MEIKHYDIEQSSNSVKPGWRMCWHGLCRLEECVSPKAVELYRVMDAEAHKELCLSEFEFDRDIILSLITGMKTKDMTMIELGAGYGERSIAAAGVVRNKLIPTKVKSVRCYAVEAEPTHARWARQHFGKLELEGVVYECVVSDKDGICQFALERDPSYYYGQSMVRDGGLIRTLNKLVRKKRINIPEQTLDTLIDNMEPIGTVVVDMDVQGAEVKVLRGAENTIKRGVIDYCIIGTHGKQYHQQLYELLAPYYKLEVDIKPNAITEYKDMKVKVCDGIQVYSKGGV